MFIVKIMEFINSKRMDLFQSLFFNLYEKYNGDADYFVEEWFRRYTYATLKTYFKEDLFRNDLDEFFNKNKNVIKAYVKAYWSFCNDPNARPHHIKVAMDFFGIKELSEKELKEKFREMVKLYHPDIHPNKKEATLKMMEINHHYQILKAFLEKYGGE
ncbi:MAG: DnaJ domain-containing protein [Sulfurihydrogenibium azorense]|uniref:DnaJ domain-containing protein n=1 Tax=Sulfurihydrogenibium azorense TaxID=309806 RepID=UPI00391B28BD